MKSSNQPIPSENAETIALQALAFVASDAASLNAFIRDTGVTLDQLHINAGEPTVMNSVLEYLLRDESSLLMFTANAGLDSDIVMRAHHAIQQHLTRDNQ